MGYVISAIGAMLSKKPTKNDAAYQLWINEYRKETYEYVYGQLNSGIFNGEKI